MMVKDPPTTWPTTSLFDWTALTGAGPCGPGTVLAGPTGPVGPCGPGTVLSAPGMPCAPCGPIGPAGPGGPIAPWVSSSTSRSVLLFGTAPSESVMVTGNESQVPWSVDSASMW